MHVMSPLGCEWGVHVPCVPPVPTPLRDCPPSLSLDAGSYDANGLGGKTSDATTTKLMKSATAMRAAK